MAQFFSKKADRNVKIVLFGLLFAGPFAVFVVWYWFSPWHTDVGYQPIQPIEFSHKQHAGDLGIDCRYCHSAVDKSTTAGVPSSQTCMKCHATVKNDSLLLKPLLRAHQDNVPIPWVRVHKVPDFAYFDHSAHVLAGVGCISCHGAVQRMERINLQKPLSMSWCLECHKDPTPHLRPVAEATNMDWTSSPQWENEALLKSKAVHPPYVSCSGCHR